MKATTHTELYRPFRGRLGSTARQPLVFLRSGFRVARRKKLPFLLFVVPAIQTVVTSFIVNVAFSLESGDVPSEMDARTRFMAMALASAFTQVEEQIVNLLAATQFFSLLVVAWYGSGLIADDRRLKAHLLYFSRPVSRWSYIAGKLLVVGAWGSLAIVVPASIVLLVSVFSSPDWAFLTDRWRTIVNVEVFAFTWLALHALGILAISSVVKRRNHALVVAVGFFVLTNASALLLADLLDSESWLLLSVYANFDRIAEAWLGVERGELGWPIGRSYAVLGTVALVCLWVLVRRVGQMEREA